MVRLVRKLDLAVGVDEELMEVPLNVLVVHDGRADVRLAHPLPSGISAAAVDLGLLDDGEGDAVLRLELDDVRRAARLLVQELVARVGEDLKAVRLVVGVDLN